MFKNVQKRCSEKMAFFYFSLLPRAAQRTQTEEFMIPNMAYRPVYKKTGHRTLWGLMSFSQKRQLEQMQEKAIH